MDRAKNEIEAIKIALKEVEEQQLRELDDLHLALVGGGSGETILA